MLGVRINPYESLLTRVDDKAVSRVVEKSRENKTEGNQPKNEQDSMDMIDIEEFLKVDLRVAEVVAAEAVEGADKLIRVTVDLGDEKRSVLSGIKSAYQPEDLVGRQVVLVANLKPRQMRFGTSEGMLLAAGSEDGDIYLVNVDSGAKPGMRIR